LAKSVLKENPPGVSINSFNIERVTNLLGIEESEIHVRNLAINLLRKNCAPNHKEWFIVDDSVLFASANVDEFCEGYSFDGRHVIDRASQHRMRWLMDVNCFKTVRRHKKFAGGKKYVLTKELGRCPFYDITLCVTSKELIQ
jgi:hypothetical protein